MQFVIKAVCSQGHWPKVHILTNDGDLKGNKTLCGIKTSRSWDDCDGPADCHRCFSVDMRQAKKVGCNC